MGDVPRIACREDTFPDERHLMDEISRVRKPISQKNIIIIVVDSLRNDAMSEYASIFKSLNFKVIDAVSQASWTVPSHASLFTGLFPIQHKKFARPARSQQPGDQYQLYKIDEHLQKYMINNILKKYSYKRYLFSANAWITPSFGYNDFELIFESAKIKFDNKVHLNEKELMEIKQYDHKNKFRLILSLISDLKFGIIRKYMLQKTLVKYSKIFHQALVKWPKDKGVSLFIKKIKRIEFKDPFFMFMNLMEVHNPYYLRDTYYQDTIENLKTNYLNNKKVKKWNKKYKEFVSYEFKKILEIIDTLKRKDVFDNSLIIITSDHGQLMGEHNRINHGIFLYDELIKVPFLFKIPKNMKYLSKKNVDGQHVSLNNVKKVILKMVNEGYFDENELYADYAYSETHGIYYKFDDMDNSNKTLIEKYNNFKICFYHGEKKYLFNVNDWCFENQEIKDNQKSKQIIIKYLQSFLSQD